MPGDKLAICYAEEAAQGIAKSAYPHGFEHHYWHPDRLEEPLKVKKPSGIFLDSMSDLMGRVTDKRINQVLDICRRAHWHTFFLLTKNAPRLAKFDFPDNVWVGVSMPPDYMYGKKLTREQQEKMLTKSLKVLNLLPGVIRWMSFEPLSWDVSKIIAQYPGVLDWCVIGAASGRRKKHPPQESHLKDLLSFLGKDTRVYFKGNLRSLPWADDNWREEFPLTHTPAPQETTALQETTPLRKLGDKFQRGTSILEIVFVSLAGGYLVNLSTCNETHEATPFPVTDNEITAWVAGKTSPIPDPAIVGSQHAVTNETSTAIIPITAATTHRESLFRRQSLPVNQIINMDSFAYLKTLPDNSVHCMVTSPPYWGLRDYGVDGQIGLEETLAEFIARLVELFREARRVLRNDGTLWVNMGDSYASAPNGRSAADTNAAGNDDRTFRDKPFSTVGNGLKPKDLIGQPWRLALALQYDGWYLRSDIIWNKTNCMPESVQDRPTRNHEYVFLFAKSQRYYYDREAITEPVKNASLERAARAVSDHHKNLQIPGQTTHSMHRARANGDGYNMPATKNKRTVWTLPTKGFPDAHFATFPEALIEPMILAGCPPTVCTACGSPHVRLTEKEFIAQEDVSLERGIKGAPGQKPQYKDNQWGGVPRGSTLTKTTGCTATCNCGTGTEPGIVLDMFMGSGTTGLVALKNGRRYMGCDLKPEYVEMARNRLSNPIAVDMFTSATAISTNNQSPVGAQLDAPDDAPNQQDTTTPQEATPCQQSLL